MLIVVACGGETVLQQQDDSIVEDLSDAGGGAQQQVSNAQGTVEFDGQTHQFDEASFCELDESDPVPVRATFGDEMFQDPGVDALVIARVGDADTHIAVELGEFRWETRTEDSPQITHGTATWDSLVLREVNGQAEDATMTITISCG